MMESMPTRGIRVSNHVPTFRKTVVLYQESRMGHFQYDGEARQ